MLYAYYGDDFTGSTDVLETLARAGVRAALFLRPPTAEDLAEFPGLQAVGIAGDSRSRSPEWMSENLPRIFAGLKAFGAPVTHYKTCSTFDSAPHIGSIGRAMELGIEAFGAGFVPIVVGAPHLGRYVVFGNLFATAGGDVYRIDRHPTMSRHPVTPMLEADLRRHLALQTDVPIGLVDLRDLTLGYAAGAVLFDTFDENSLRAVGDLIWAGAARPLFAVGSSGLTESLIPAWRVEGLIDGEVAAGRADEVEQILVLSGSCSPVTQVQIEWGLAHGFAGVEVDAAALVADPIGPMEQALELLHAGRSPIIYTALGPLGAAQSPYDARLGAAMGELLREIVVRSEVRRVVLSGGDTSSHAMQQLPVRALTWAAALAPGAPLCRAHAPGSAFHNVEFVLKGGQVGGVDFFGVVRGDKAKA